RMIVEGMRTDSLYIANTTIRVSQLLSAIIVVVFAAWLITMFVKLKKGTLSRKYLINPPPVPFVLQQAPVDVSYVYSSGKSTASETDFFKVNIKEEN
ncbi:MAG: prolipoprotein diacylglyceryl transferase, partial [Eubacterium sp.]|nr:prolipoprotein diacylglyceryl transferase [Eubacterium sp.]